MNRDQALFTASAFKLVTSRLAHITNFTNMIKTKLSQNIYPPCFAVRKRLLHSEKFLVEAMGLILIWGGLFLGNGRGVLALGIFPQLAVLLGGS